MEKKQMMEQEQMEQMMEQEHWSSETRCPGQALQWPQHFQLQIVLAELTLLPAGKSCLPTAPWQPGPSATRTVPSTAGLPTRRLSPPRLLGAQNGRTTPVCCRPIYHVWSQLPTRPTTLPDQKLVVTAMLHSF